MSDFIKISNDSIFNIEMIEKFKNTKEKIIIITSSQSLFQYEKDLVDLLGINGLFNVEILSFDRLINNYSNYYIKNKIVANKVSQMSLLLNSVSEVENDNFFIKNMNDFQFFVELYTNMNDMRNNLVTPNYFEYMIEKENLKNDIEKDNYILNKLIDYNKIYSIFSTKMDILYDKFKLYNDFINELNLNNIEIDAYIYVEGFSNLTEIEVNLLVALAKNVKFLQINLLKEEIGITEYINNFILFLKQKIYENNMRIEFEFKEIVINKFATEFKNIFLYDNKIYNIIKIKEFNDKNAEILYVGYDILKLVKKLNYKYSDIVVLMNDIDNFKDLIDNCFSNLDIPYFIDEKRKILYHSLPNFLLSLLDIFIYGFNKFNVLNFLKNKYVIEKLSFDLVCKIENFANIFNINFINQWKKDFNGLTEDENIIKNQFFVELNDLKEKFNNAVDIIEKIELILFIYEKYNIIDCINKEIEYLIDKNDFDRANEVSQIYETLKNILYEIYEINKDNKSLNNIQLYNLIKFNIENTFIKVIPYSENLVTVGDLSRTKIVNKKILYCIFMNDGNIPKSKNTSSIFSDYEYEYLSKDYRIKNQFSFEYQYEKEVQNLYEILNKVEDEVIFTYSLKGNNSEDNEKSIWIEQLLNNKVKYFEISKIDIKYCLFILKNLKKYLYILQNQEMDYGRYININLNFFDFLNKYLRKSLYVYLLFAYINSLNSICVEIVDEIINDIIKERYDKIFKFKIHEYLNIDDFTLINDLLFNINDKLYKKDTYDKNFYLIKYFNDIGVNYYEILKFLKLINKNIYSINLENLDYVIKKNENYIYNIDLLFNDKKYIDILKSYIKGLDFTENYEVSINEVENDDRFSATKLELYKKCPYSFFLKYKIFNEIDESNDLTSLDFGNLVHFTLEYVFNEIQKNEIDFKNIDFINDDLEIDNKIKQYIDKAINKKMSELIKNEFRNNYKNQFFIELLKIILLKNIKIIIIQQNKFNIKKFENEINFNHKLNYLKFLNIDENLLKDFENIILNGKIDRLNFLKFNDYENNQMIIDYKTGEGAIKNLSKKNVENGIELQLMIYILSLMYNLSGNIDENFNRILGAYYYYFCDEFGNEDDEFLKKYRLEGINLNLDFFEKNKDIIKNKRDLSLNLEKFIEILEKSLNSINESIINIKNGSYSVNPLDCTYCNYKTICRYNKRR